MDTMSETFVWTINNFWKARKGNHSPVFQMCGTSCCLYISASVFANTSGNQERIAYYDVSLNKGMEFNPNFQTITYRISVIDCHGQDVITVNGNLRDILHHIMTLSEFYLKAHEKDVLPDGKLTIRFSWFNTSSSTEKIQKKTDSITASSEKSDQLNQTDQQKTIKSPDYNDQGTQTETEAVNENCVKYDIGTQTSADDTSNYLCSSPDSTCRNEDGCCLNNTDCLLKCADVTTSCHCGCPVDCSCRDEDRCCPKNADSLLKCADGATSGHCGCSVDYGVADESCSKSSDCFLRRVDKAVGCYCDCTNTRCRCEVSRSFLERATQTKESVAEVDPSKLLEILSDDFERFYDNMADPDCVLKAGNVGFPAHRAVLSARSPVFTAMFSHDTVECTSGEANIRDVDSATLKDVLHYVYTGKIRGLREDTAVVMYTTADEYALLELKEACLDFLLCNLTPENLYDATILAHTHGESALEWQIVHFVEGRLSEVQETDGWKRLLSHKPFLANKILSAALISLQGKINPVSNSENSSTL